MIVCPHCNMDLPDDSTFCTYCGKPIKKINTTTKVHKEEKSRTVTEEIILKKNPRNNPLGKLAIFLFVIALFGFDFVISTVVYSLFGNANFVFVISGVIYALAILCGVLSLLIDNRDKKNGYEPTGGFGFAFGAIIVSLYMFILNLNSIFLK